MIKVKRLENGYDLPLPKRMTKGASGCDICAANIDPIVLKPMERFKVPTGFAFEIPIGYEIQVRPRSGLSANKGIVCVLGSVDSDYRGEVKVILINLSNENFVINRGDRVAQLVPAKVANEISFIETNMLQETERGSGGFGHTGSC